MVSETERGVRRHGIACAAEAVKGLRSPSLAPMNAANYKTVRAALDCLPRSGWKVYKGSCAPRLKKAPDTILFKPVFCPTIGERLRTPDTPEEELSDWDKQVLKPVESIPYIVAHELVHYQQKYPKGERTLLAKAIKEGSADFIGELISGRHINTLLHEYGNPKERELWEEFKQEMNGTNLTKWLYNGDQVKDRPADLGYYVGYKITEAYYLRKVDKKQAIRDILEIKEFNQFLAASK